MPFYTLIIMKLYMISINIIKAYLLVFLLLNGLAQAGQVTDWQDTFTGTNGMIVAPGTRWDYVNIGVESNDWVTHPRPWAEDAYIVTNNQFYCYVGPCNADPSIYNKVQACFWPKSADDSPMYIDMQPGQAIRCGMTVADVWGNDGHRWQLNQEFKMTLTPVPIRVDPENLGTNSFEIKWRIRPVSSPGSEIWVCYGTGESAKSDLWYSGIVATNDATPVSLSMVISSNGRFAFYRNAQKQAEVNTGIPYERLQRLYLQVWHGKFNGQGPESTDGYMIIDNVSLGYFGGSVVTVE